MASLITHPVVPIVAAAVMGRKIIPLPLLLVGVIYSILPDADSIGFRFGIPYASPFGHRGFSHSLCFALAFALAAVPFARKFDVKPVVIFLFLFLSMTSHGLLDALTNRGNGVAFFWPLDNTRFFFGFHPVEASPLSIERFLSVRGLEILRSEFLWIWTPLLAIATIGYSLRKGLASSNH